MVLPTGTVSFLFADIEGSTRLLDRLGESYEIALGDERRILRDAAEQCGGTEVDVQGDAVFLSFERASDAVRAAVRAQRAMDGHSWPAGASVRVRIGLHTGEARLTDAGYVGMDVHRAARICSAGHGGQALLSQTTRDLVEHELDEGVWLRDLGEHVLKDLRYPEHVFQLVVSGLPSDFPPIDSLSDHSHNLPLQPTGFVGRGAELEQVKELIGRERLVTIAGPGGVGKTRLALHVAAELVDGFRDGAWHVDATPLATSELLLGATARAMRLTLGGLGVDTKTELLDYLGCRSLLLVVDNFEHLVGRADLLVEVLEHAPELRILVTSRERLNVRGEWVFELSGLPYSEARTRGDASTATRLFLDRAHQTVPELTPSARDLAAVRRICELVEGMPLAVELAAPWVSVLTCAEIEAEIRRGIDFLTTTMRDVPAWHRSLRAVFERSWAMLSEPEQAALPKLAVFRGGFRRDAALEVAGVDVAVLAALARKSLLRHGADDRFSVHEVVRQYAEEKLVDTVEASAVRERHAAYYTRFVADRGPSLVSEEPLRSTEEVVAELGNVRSAVVFAVGSWDDGLAHAAVLDLSPFCFTQNPGDAAAIFGEVVDALEDRGASLELGGRGSRALAAALAWKGYFEGFNGDRTSEARLRANIPFLRAPGLRPELGICLLALGMMAYVRSDYEEASEALEESLAICRSEGDKLLTGACLLWLGWVRQDCGDSDGAGLLYREAYELSERSHLGLVRAYALSKLGMWADGRQEYAQSWGYHDRARAAFESLENEAGRALALSRMSVSAWGLGEYEEAERLGREALDSFTAIGHRWGIPACHCRIGFAELAQGRVRDAQASFEAGLRAALRSDMVAVELYALVGLGTVLAREGRAERAAQLLDFALRHPETPEDYKLMARPELSALEEVVAADVLEGSRRESLALDDVVQGALSEVAAEPRLPAEPVFPAR